jgi:hypothetical protein
MRLPYRARVNERTLLNLPGFHHGAFVYVYVEDTAERDLMFDEYCAEDCECCPHNFEPRMVLEIADCDRVIALSFDIDTPGGRDNSLYKLDTLIAALRVFRANVVAEFEPYDRRERSLAARKENDPGGGSPGRRPAMGTRL